MAGGHCVNKLEKPRLVNLHLWQSVKNLGAAIFLAGLAGATFKIMYVNPKKFKYEEFYREYKPMVSFERMLKAGVFQSCKYESETPSMKK